MLPMSAWLPLLASLVTCTATIYYVYQLRAADSESTQKNDRPASREVRCTTQRRVKVSSLAQADVPDVLRPSYYFRHIRDFKHYDLFQNSTNVFDVLDRLHGYVERWLDGYTPDKSMTTVVTPCKVGEVSLTCSDVSVTNACTILNYSTTSRRRFCLDEGVRIMGGIFDVTDGSIFLGKNVVVEPNVYIKGPAIIGDDTVLRFGAYLRGDVVTGNNCVIRCEIKHAVIMDKAELGHPGHFANQVSTANLALLATSSQVVTVNGVAYDTGRRKVGVVLGDESQLGCNVATDPCTLIGVHTAVYPLTRLNKGVYGPNEIIKNKPLEHGIVERCQVRPAAE
ncbi:hypothetical protein DYB36_001975 [Aphanomyces astaci]|uniref:Uncharacterized protein n=2 Tax=Aphanomyces astaci TaxID=112090 RepID=A0A397AW82_APHAT|nr:hypothetical protein DYB36_001975 [Aphanomyces astaci]